MSKHSEKKPAKKKPVVKRIEPPRRGHPDDKLRNVVEAGASLVPMGSAVVKLVNDMLPTQSEKARRAWEELISQRMNEDQDRFDELELLIAASTPDEQGTHVLADLAFLAFWNDGMRGPLEKLASGGGGATELAEIARLLADSEQDVGARVDRLLDAREGFVAANFGMPFARAFEKVVLRKVGPDAIRDRLGRFTKTRSDTSGIKYSAAALVAEIDMFDAELSRVHEEIRTRALKSS